MPALQDLSGTRVGRLTVIHRADVPGKGEAFWECRCACGNIAVVSGSNLRRSHTLSCGCLRDETRSQLKHGMRQSSEYAIWNGIKACCENPKNPAFARYGGRGIVMHPAWSDSFEAFYAAVGPRPSIDHSIDRVDNALGYEPGNVRWATRSEQARNSRRFKGGNNESTRKAEMAEDILRLEREKAESQAEALKLHAEKHALLDENEEARTALSVRDQEVAWLEKRVEQIEEGRRIVMRDTAADRQWLRDNPTVTTINVNAYTCALDLVEKQAEQLAAAKLRLVDMSNAAAMLDSVNKQLAAMTKARDRLAVLAVRSRPDAFDKAEIAELRKVGA